jgi:hypothetical protein
MLSTGSALGVMAVSSELVSGLSVRGSGLSVRGWVTASLNASTLRVEALFESVLNAS